MIRSRELSRMSLMTEFHMRFFNIFDVTFVKLKNEMHEECVYKLEKAESI